MGPTALKYNVGIYILIIMTCDFKKRKLIFNAPIHSSEADVILHCHRVKYKTVRFTFEIRFLKKKSFYHYDTTKIAKIWQEIKTKEEYNTIVSTCLPPFPRESFPAFIFLMVPLCRFQTSLFCPFLYYMNICHTPHSREPG